jgi:invasion protein IalB
LAGFPAAAIALMAAVLAVTAGPPAFAQTPPAPKVQPKAQPKAAPQQQAPAPVQPNTPQAPQLPPITFTPWTKVCVKGQEGGPQQICVTGKEGHVETGVLAVGATLMEAEGQPQKILRLTLPLGMILPQGTRAIVDQGQPMSAPYLICLQNGCMAEYEASEELIGKLKKGQTLVVQGVLPNGPLTLQVPLADFAKAYDGPPTDQKVYEERQKKMEEEFQKKREQLIQQQQQQQQQAAPK